VPDLIGDGVTFPSKNSKTFWFKRSSKQVPTKAYWVISTDGCGGYTASKVTFNGDTIIAKGHLSDILNVDNSVCGKKLAELNTN